MNEMGDQANKIKTIISQFDDIDQETLLAMLAISDEVDNAGDSDPSAILDESKNQVLTFITEIKELAESQESLVESLKAWFNSLRDTASFLETETNSQPEEPDTNAVYDRLRKIVDDCTERTEKAACLHNDVTDFWMKQIAQAKRILTQKDEEIHKLNEVIEAAANARAKRTRQKQQQKSKGEELEASKGQIESQLRVIEEQKGTIDRLKQQLQSSEISRASAGLATTREASQDNFQNQVEHDHAINAAKYESEAKIAVLNERIQKLQKEEDTLQNIIMDEKLSNKKLQKELEEKKMTIKELEATNQKNLKMLALERDKPVVKTPPPDVPSENEDLILQIVQAKEEIKALQDKHREEMIQQGDTLRAKFAVEKEKLFEAINEGDSSYALKQIVEDYEKKLEKQKTDYDSLQQSTARQWGAKLSLLTHQFENRIKALNTSHTAELIAQKENQKYELKKAELEIEEVYNKKLIDMTREKSESESLQEKIDSLKDKLSLVQKENDQLRQVTNVYAITNQQLKDDLAQIKKSKVDAISHTTSQVYNNVNEAKLIETYTARMRQLRVDLHDHEQWILKQQKNFYEREISKETDKHQKETKELLLRIQDSLSKLSSEGETPITLSDAIMSLNDAYIAMNSQIENSKISDEETIPFNEANKRILVLTDRIQKLSQELASYQNNMQSDSANMVSSRSILQENEIENLQQKIKFLESLQTGNSQEALEKMKEMEEYYQAEIKAKDALIEVLQESQAIPRPSINTEDFEFEEFTIFSVYYEIETREYVPEISSPTKPPPQEEPIEISHSDSLQRSLPDFVVIKTPDVEPMKKSPSVFFEPVYEQKEPFLESQPEVVPVILEIKDKNVFERPEKNEEIPPPPPSSPRETAPSTMQVRTEMKQKSNVGTNRSFSFRAPRKVEIATQINSETTSVFKALDKPNYRVFKQSSIDLEPEYISASPSEKARLFMSTVTSKHIPSRIIDTIAKAPRVIRRSSNRDMQFEEIFEAPLPPPPPPVVIEPDQETMNIIHELTEKLKELEKQNQNPDENNPSLDRQRLFTEMRIKIIDAGNKIIDRQKKIIEELNNKPPRIVYETRIVSVPDVQLDDEPRQRRVQKPIDMSSVPKLNANKQEPQPRPKPSFQMAQQADVAPETSPLDLDYFGDRKFAMPPAKPIIERPTPTPIFIDIDDSKISEDEIMDDPFTAAIRMLAEDMRFMAQFTDNEHYIVSTMKNDTNAYEAYLVASEAKDESHRSYLRQTRETQECFDQNYLKLEDYGKMQHKLLQILKQSKRRARIIAEAAASVQNANISSKLDQQNKLLNDLAKDKAKDISSAESQLTILQNLQQSLDIIRKMNIALTSDQNSRYAVLTKRVNDYIQQVANQKPLQQKTIEQIIFSVQNFVSTVKPESAEATSDIYQTAKNIEMKNVQNKVKKINKEKEKLERKLNMEIEKQNQLNNQVKTLKARLAEEKELNENAVSLYQSQILMLREVFSHLSENKEPSDPLGLVGAVKNEVLSLQALLEASISERDVYKSKTADIQDQLAAKETEITNLRNEFEELQVENEALEAKIRKNRETLLFHETDMEKLLEEKKADIDLSNQHKSQLQSSIAQNAQLNADITTLQNKILRQKAHIHRLKEENDDLSINLAIGRYKIDHIPKPSIATQTILRAITKPKKKETPKPAEDDIPVRDNVVIQTHEEEEEAPVKEERPVSPLPPPPVEIPTDINVINEEEDKISIKSVEAPPPEEKPKDTEEEESHAEEEEVEWVFLHEEDAEDYVTDITQSKHKRHKVGFLDEKAPEDVHRPLDWQHKRPKPILDEKRPKSTRYEKPSLVRPKTSFALGDDSNLAIGNVNPGQRSIHGSKGKVRPTVTSRQALNLKTAHVTQPSPNSIEPLKTTRSFRGAEMSPSTPKTHRPATPGTQYSPSPQENVDTIRITRINYQDTRMTTTPRQPFVSPIEKFSIQCDPMTVTGTTSRQSQGPDLAEIHKITTKLRDRIEQLRQSVMKKDGIISALKKKLGDLFHEKQLLEMAATRSSDHAKRATIRYQNASHRLEIAMRELGLLEDDISKFKAENSRLRCITSPTKVALSKLNQSRMEQMMLRREAEKKTKLLHATRNAIDKTIDKQVHKHLGKLLENTQKSLARIESKKQMWIEQERKQVMGALSALSLINEKPSDIILQTQISPWNTSRVMQMHNLWANRAAMREEEMELLRPINMTPRSISSASHPKKTIPSYSRTLELLDRIPLSEEEKRNAMRGEMSPELAEKLREIDENEKYVVSLDREVIVPNK